MTEQRDSAAQRTQGRATALAAWLIAFHYNASKFIASQQLSKLALNLRNDQLATSDSLTGTVKA